MATKKKNLASKAKSKAKAKAKRQAKKAGKSAAAQIMPVILLLIAVFLLVCFVLNLIFNFGNHLDGSEGEHPMGPLGFYVCEFFFGFFGFCALFIPIALAFFSMFWKRLDDAGRAVGKTVLAAGTLLLASAFVHILLTLIAGDELSYDFAELYESGAALSGGGVVGGYIGYLFYLLLNLGSVFVLGIVVGVMACYLFGFKLHVLIGKLGDLIKDKWDNRDRTPKEKKVKPSKYDDGEEDEEDDDEEDIPVKPIKIKQPKPERAEKPERAARAEESAPAAADEQDAPDISALDDDDDDESYRSAAPVNAFGGASAPKREGERAPVAEAEEQDTLRLDALEEEDFEDSLKVDGRTPMINKETGEVIFTDAPDTPDLSALDEEDLAPADGEGEDAADEGEGDDEYKPREYIFPPLELLKTGSLKPGISDDEIEENKQILRDVLESFKIKIKDITCCCGPTITRYEIKPDAGVRVKQISGLVDDISMALATPGVRIEAPIPGKAAVGVEVPNATRGMVLIRSILETPEFQNHKSRLAACLGTDVSGKPIVFDIEKMPHLLVAGTTGSGKSVCINTIIASLLYRTKPEEVKLVLIDPKKVEFNVFRDIPHLSCKIVTDPKKAAGALNSAVNEMEKRFELIEEVGVRNITGYNEATKNDPDKPFMPRMVIIIDELADLMMTVGEEVENAICRIAQKARAAGIHLVLGTQRPSTDVITGLMKANIPSRIAFTVASQIDSRVILDNVGAEKLTGMGDMLFSPVGSPKPIRVQGTFVSDSEIESIVNFIKANNAPVRYDSEFEKSIDAEAAKYSEEKTEGGGAASAAAAGDDDALLYDAVKVGIEAKRMSTSLLQRKLKIGYGRAAKIIDRLEELGYVGPPDGPRPREMRVTENDLRELLINNNNDQGMFD